MEGAGEVSWLAIFSLYEFHQLLHGLLLDEVIVRRRVYPPNIFTRSALGAFITLYSHMDIIPTNAVFTDIYDSFERFVLQLIIRLS